jgi:hypothetical protein
MVAHAGRLACKAADALAHMSRERQMSDIPMKRYWMGQDVDTLPREKLIEIIDHLHRQLEGARAATRSVIEINDLARRSRARS